jgi:uncharacterized protein YbcI
MEIDRAETEADFAVRSNGDAVGESKVSVAAALSNEMVRIYKETFGRGPTKARVDWAGSDLLVCTLEDSLTPAERKMAELGEDQRVREIRLFFQHATEENFRESVERITGRKVRAFTSGTDTEKDVSSEVFYLEPQAG